MIRRMADKLGHLGTLKADPSPSSAASSVKSRQSTSLDSASGLHRGSISTQRTSVSAVSEWSNKRGGSDMEIVEQEPEPEGEMPQTAARTSAVVRKQKGAYRLSDFIIQRTLGTGSFGRVHLGVSSEELTIALLADHLTGCSAEQT
jgi:protein kinase A